MTERLAELRGFIEEDRTAKAATPKECRVRMRRERARYREPGNSNFENLVA